VCAARCWRRHATAVFKRNEGIHEGRAGERVLRATTVMVVVLASVRRGRGTGCRWQQARWAAAWQEGVPGAKRRSMRSLW